MKNKPLKHKSTNTFKFLPFAERISSIDVRHAALYYVDHANAEKPKDNQTYFNAALIKWGTLNLTKQYKEYRTKFNDVVTLPQLIHKKDEVIQELLNKLQERQTSYLQPLLEIVVALAKDLRDDFYQFFPQIFDVLVDLLATKDAEQLEWTFVCLAFLFKILRPFLKKDITVILRNILPLLSELRADYIVNFAAESFAFVARDIKDKKSFLNLLLKYAKASDDNAIAGCGHLLFEIIKGAKEHFHSCAEEFIHLLLTSLRNSHLHRELLFNIITQIVTDILYTIDVRHGDLLWKTLYKSVEEEIDKWKLEESEADIVALEYILRLIGQALEFRQGYFLQDVNPLIHILIKLSGFKTIPENIQQISIKISTVLLLSDKFNLEQEYAARLIRKILLLPDANILIDFVVGVTSYAQFEIMILPHFLEFVVQSDFSDATLLALARICLIKSPLAMCGNNLFSWVKYPLDFGPITKKFNDVLILSLKFDKADDILNNPHAFLIALICLPHVKIAQETECYKLLKEIITKFVTLLKEKISHGELNSDTDKLIRTIIFLLANVIECSIHIDFWNNPEGICDFEFVLEPLLPFANNYNLVGVLQLIDLYVTAYDVNHILSYEYVKKIHCAINSNLSSPYHEVRLYTTHIYSVCEKTISRNLSSDENDEPLELFTLSYEVESIQPSIQEYREQITKLQRIAFNTRQFEKISKSDFKLYPVQYMFGALHMNFKLMWGPISELIAGYANGLRTEMFWGVFCPILTRATTASTTIPTVNVVFDDFDEKANLVCDIYKEYFRISQKIDFVNYRILLWRAMEGFASVCEERNRDITVMFLNFIEDEFKNSQAQNTLLMNIQKHGGSNEEANSNVEIEVETFEEVENHTDADANVAIQGKDLYRVLLAHLNFFTKVKNPKALYKESTLKEIYLDFLKNQNSVIQKLALDCVMAYKSKNLTPYKENLYNIVNDKKLKEELVSFRIDEENENIISEHREELVPILMRILYGKMVSKVHSDKKNGGQVRRSLVLRYLAGCGQNELLIFNKMAFGFLDEYLSLDVNDLRNKILQDFNLKSMFKPKKLQSALNLVEVMREHFGGRMGDELLPQLLKVIYCCVTMVGLAFVKLDEIHAGYLEIIKKLRVQCLKIVTSFFSHFDERDWSESELLLIHEYLIWPLLKRLPIEGIHSPTALLKLFGVWGQNPRHFALLTVYQPNDVSLTPLPYIFKLLLAPKTQSTVVLTIIRMIEKMFTLQENSDSSDWKAFVTFNSVPIDGALIENLKMKEELNYGTKILIPYVREILEILKRRIKTKSKYGGIGRTELLILSRVTELVSTSETCDSLLGLLLAVLIKKVSSGRAEDTVEQSIQTISNLLKRSSAPEKYIKSMASLFSSVTSPNTRKLLISLLETIAQASSDKENYEVIYDVMNELNSYNKRWIDQPDFDRRLNAYKRVYEMLDEDKISADLGVLIMHNCFFSVNNDNDLSLRDSAGQCLRKVAPKLVLKFTDTPHANFVVRETVVQLIIVNIRRTDREIVKNEAISLLGELARRCPQADAVFRDLSPLCDDSDREVDFFDNMTHMQSHRKVRALLKFCSVMRKVKVVPSPKTLSRIVLPLVSEFICNEKYAAKNSLVDACIDAVAICSRLLPWHRYEALLKFYLSKLRSSIEYQKQLIRLVIVILDGFHFDFSKAELVSGKECIETHKEHKESDNADEPEDLENETVEMNDNSEDVLETELNIEVNEEAEELEEDAVKVNILLPASERIIILSPSTAKRTLATISVGLLIDLRESISQLSSHEGSHKINRRKTSYDREQEEIVKVPIALALVKLLQKLPEPMLANNLPGIFTKLCVFLKTPLRQVRMVARDIVKKIMQTVGSKYLGVLLYHLKLLLTRGYQVHVLVATIHDSLETLKCKFQKGDIDEHLSVIIDICMNDLFGEISEEKEVNKIVGKTPEAKASKKCFVTLNILAQNISENSIIKLVFPFKELLLKTHSKKTLTKIQDSFSQFVQGLSANEFIPIDVLLNFLHGLVSETIPDLTPEMKNQVIGELEREKLKRAKPDCFLIPETPRRHREALKTSVRTSSKTNAPALVEFGLSLLHLLLKRDRLKGVNAVSFLDPMMHSLNDALKNSHIKVVIASLKCLTSIWISKFSLPQLDELIKDITKSIFHILHKYAVSGLTKSNDNYQLVHNAFKAVTALVRHVSYHTIDLKQLKALLLYAEQDMQGFERQSTAFTLLKAILDAKLISPVVHQVMAKVATISVISDAPKTREETRTIFFNYLMNYPMGNKIVRHLQFFTSQLHFELEYGKESSLKMLEMIVSKFPLESLEPQAGFIFTALGASLVDDLSPSCKELSAKCIEILIKRLDIPSRDKLFNLTMVFFSDAKDTHCEMGALLVSRFVSVETANFKERLRILLPAVLTQIFCLQVKIGGFVRLQSLEAEAGDDQQKQRHKDHALIQILILLEKICSACSTILTGDEFCSEIDEVSEHCQNLLAHPHIWVRLKAAKLLNVVLSFPRLELLKNVVESNADSHRKFIYYDTGKTLKSLVLDLCAQLTPGDVSQEMANEVTSDIMKIVIIVNSIPLFCIPKSQEEKENKCISVLWIVNRLRLTINSEMIKSPHSTIIRCSIFNTLILIINLLEVEDLKLVLASIIITLVREMTNANDSVSEVRQIAGRVAKKIRRRLGDMEFNEMVAKAQMNLNAKRVERKKILLQEKVHNPEKAQKRKMHVKEKKVIQKKKKMDVIKGKKPGKRKRAPDSDDEF